MSKWIDVKDRLPKDETKVKGRFENGEESEIFFWSKEEGFDPYKDPLHTMVTHWQPLPKPPKT